MILTLPKIVVILGPTAVGKSALAVRLARKFGGEIISADSRQVYRGLNIGTGKITERERRGVRHHLLDVASPRRQFTVVQFKFLAEQAIKDILRRGKLPIICGGTGFYLQALVDNLVLPPVPPRSGLRQALAKLSIVELWARLQKLDLDRAQNIDSNNPRRLIRAIEIAEAVGEIGILKVGPPQYDWLPIGVRIDPAVLKQKISDRLRRRLRVGLIAEVRRLRHGGLSWRRLDSLGLEYRFVAQHLRGELSRQELEEQLARAIWHYARRQMTWFRRDRRIRWIKNYREAERLARRFISSSK